MLAWRRWVVKLFPCTFRAIALVCLLLSGCEQMPTQVRALRSPPPEAPPANPHPSLHQRNKTGPQGEGSCVHASLVNHWRWLNRHEIAAKWWATYGDGEYASRLMERLDAAGEKYVYTEKADPRFLDWCSQTRRGAILWWKPSHCCTFEGWVTDKSGKQFAAVLDNNRPGVYEYHEREQFIRGWAGFGGFALSSLSPPPTANVWQSYEVVK